MEKFTVLVTNMLMTRDGYYAKFQELSDGRLTRAEAASKLNVEIVD